MFYSNKKYLQVGNLQNSCQSGHPSKFTTDPQVKPCNARKNKNKENISIETPCFHLSITAVEGWWLADVLQALQSHQVNHEVLHVPEYRPDSKSTRLVKSFTTVFQHFLTDPVQWISPNGIKIMSELPEVKKNGSVTFQDHTKECLTDSVWLVVYIRSQNAESMFWSGLVKIRTSAHQTTLS